MSQLICHWASAQNFDVLTAYAKTPQINTHADVSSKVRCLNFGLSLHLNRCSANASSEQREAKALASNITVGRHPTGVFYTVA